MIKDAILGLIGGIIVIMCTTACENDIGIGEYAALKVVECLLFCLSGICFGTWIVERRYKK